MPVLSQKWSKSSLSTIRERLEHVSQLPRGYVYSVPFIRSLMVLNHKEAAPMRTFAREAFEMSHYVLEVPRL